MYKIEVPIQVTQHNLNLKKLLKNITYTFINNI